MPTYLVLKSDRHYREGIERPGDLVEIFEGPYPPGGPGYRSFDIIEVTGLTKEDVQPILISREVKIRFIHDEILDRDREYWFNSALDTWYEIIVPSKYELNFANLTEIDKAVLVNSEEIRSIKMSVLSKAVANVTVPDENKQKILT